MVHDLIINVQNHHADLGASILAGGAVAALSFSFAVLWDLAKFRRDRDARRRAALTAFVEEMRANSEAAGNNLNLIGFEEHDRSDGNTKALVNPLSSLETGAWLLARLDLPDGLVRDVDLVRRLQVISRNTSDINSLIQSREVFRIQHLDRDALLVTGLQGYGHILMHMMRDLRERHSEALGELAAHLQPRARRRRWRSRAVARTAS